ncbi:hypothetical protein G9A89_020939 [Geosiphon pyriformis]|nr:hypothetical protein G9A89_020939 [Geosiphon pyriformis]
MKKTTKVSGSESGFKVVVSKKKRKGGVLAEGSETDDTTESESIDMEKKYLVEKTSVDYGESGAFTEGDPNQTPKGLRVKTKKVLEKPLGVIDYGTVNTDNDVLDNSFLLLPPLLVKLFVQVPVRKSFALDIDLVVVAGKSSQEKLSFIRKIFSSVNDFGGASTSSKFGGIIHVTFTSEKAMMATGKKNAVCVAKADVDKQTWDSRDRFRALLYTLPIGTNTYDLWDFLDLVGGKTCVIDCNPVDYTHAHCTSVGFESEDVLLWAMVNMPVIKDICLCWSHLSTALCSSCNSLGYTSLVCKSDDVSLGSKSKRAPLSAQDWFRLAKIYERKSAPIFRPLAFGGKTWASVVGFPPSSTFHGYDSQLGSIRNGKPLPPVVNNLEKHLVSIKSSLVSLIEQIGELAKRLESFVPAVSQPSPGCQLLVTLLLQNQEENIVMEVGSSDATSDKTAAVSGSTALPKVVKLENMLEDLSALVMSLSVCLNGLALAGGAPPLPLFQ